MSPKVFSQPEKYQISETQTPEAKATSYNNFYEFGTAKDEPVKNAQNLILLNGR